nr:hypothetical protein [Chitinispirillaceae bacterium]
IPSVFIEGDEDVLSEEISPAVQQEELKASLMNKFSNCISNPLMKKLFVTVYNYRIIGKNQ